MTIDELIGALYEQRLLLGGAAVAYVPRGWESPTRGPSPGMGEPLPVSTVNAWASDDELHAGILIS
jgi:hypothetical protein